LKEAIVHGAVKRVRPKMMTVVAAFMGLLPIMWSTGAGAEVMKRIAAPMVGGLATSFLLELLVYPMLYAVWKWRFVLRRGALLPPTPAMLRALEGEREARSGEREGVGQVGAAVARLPGPQPAGDGQEQVEFLVGDERITGTQFGFQREALPGDYKVAQRCRGNGPHESLSRPPRWTEPLSPLPCVRERASRVPTQ
jgi:hypothetical protein